MCLWLIIHVYVSGEPISESIKLFNSKIKGLFHKVTEQNLKTFTDFFFSTFFHHYKLYQCVFTTEQEKLQIKMDLPVETPVSPSPFKEGKDISIWEYQKKVEAVEQEESVAKKEREAALQQAQEIDKAELQDKQKKVEEAPFPMERQVKQICSKQSSLNKCTSNEWLAIESQWCIV